MTCYATLLCCLLLEYLPVHHDTNIRFGTFISSGSSLAGLAWLGPPTCKQGDDVSLTRHTFVVLGCDMSLPHIIVLFARQIYISPCIMTLISESNSQVMGRRSLFPPRDHLLYKKVTFWASGHQSVTMACNMQRKFYGRLTLPPPPIFIPPTEDWE